jgi:hypothetical protein
MEQGCWRRERVTTCIFTTLEGSEIVMSVSLIHKPALPLSSSPYRLVDDTGQDITWANTFLDAQQIREP